MALGADRSEILRLIFGETAQVLVMGISLGLVIAIACGKLVQSLLFGVTPHDISAFALGVVVLSGVALVAALLPARRAVKVDPMVALRYE